MDDLISRQAAIDVILADKIDDTSLKVMTALGDGRLALTLNSACDRHIQMIEKLPPAQPEHIQNNAVHLCDSCQYTYVTCPSHGNDAVFGDGKGNDNICACNKYRPISAQPEQRWIPCSERLPEPRIDVWCNSDMGQMVGYYEENVETWYGRDYLELMVTAWMPLPEAYKGEKK